MGKVLSKSLISLGLCSLLVLPIFWGIGVQKVEAGKAMTKSQIAAYLATKVGTSKEIATKFFDELALLAYREAKNSFVIPGIGKLVLAHRKARTGRNPQTGASINIPAKKVVKFRVAKAAKDAILGSSKKED